MTVASHRAEFVQYDPLANLTVSTPQDVHTHPELKRKIYSALAEGDEGELSIAIPKEVPLKASGGFHASITASEGNYSTPLLLTTVNDRFQLRRPSHRLLEHQPSQLSSLLLSLFILNTAYVIPRMAWPSYGPRTHIPTYVAVALL